MFSIQLHFHNSDTKAHTHTHTYTHLFLTLMSRVNMTSAYATFQLAAISSVSNFLFRYQPSIAPPAPTTSTTITEIAAIFPAPTATERARCVTNACTTVPGLQHPHPSPNFRVEKYFCFCLMIWDDRCYFSIFVRCPFREEHLVAHQKIFPLYMPPR